MRIDAAHTRQHPVFVDCRGALRIAQARCGMGSKAEVSLLSTKTFVIKYDIYRSSGDVEAGLWVREHATLYCKVLHIRRFR